MANVARKHHYVSQFYLKEFLNSNKKIHVIDVVRRWTCERNTRSIAMQRDFNRINIEGHAIDEIESHLIRY